MRKCIGNGMRFLIGYKISKGETCPGHFLKRYFEIYNIMW